jgi:hypothetical protein
VAQSRYYPGIWVEGITQPFDAIYEQFSYWQPNNPRPTQRQY